MNIVIDFFPGYEITNLSSISIEIIVGIIIGISIFFLDRRGALRQEKLLSAIASFAIRQQMKQDSGRYHNIVQIRFKLNYILEDIKKYYDIIDNENNPNPIDLLLMVNRIVRTDTNKKLVELIHGHAMELQQTEPGIRPERANTRGASMFLFDLLTFVDSFRNFLHDDIDEKLLLQDADHNDRNYQKWIIRLLDRLEKYLESELDIWTNK